MTPEFLEPPPGFDAEAWLDAVAPVIGLDIDPEYRAGVLRYLDMTARMAGHVMAFELPDHCEPAPVFRP